MQSKIDKNYQRVRSTYPPRVLSVYGSMRTFQIEGPLDTLADAACTRHC